MYVFDDWGWFLSRHGCWTCAALPILGVSVLVVMARKARKKRHKDDGKCEHCGYDLTGNTSGVCPECGERI